MRKLFARVAVVGCALFFQTHAVGQEANMRHDIEQIFGGDFTWIQTAPVTQGYAMSFTAAGGHGYLLVQGKSGHLDTIRKIRMAMCETEAVWPIGRKAAAAIAFDGRSLWVMSRSPKGFLREVSLDGRVRKTVDMKRPAPGKYYGLACAKGRVFFTSQHSGKSNVYEFDPKTGAREKLFSFPEKIYSLAWRRGRLYAFQLAFDTYAQHWLIIMDVQGRTFRKMRFLSVLPWGLAACDRCFYAMVRARGRAEIYPFAVRPSENLILGHPMKRRVAMTYRFVNGNTNPYECDLWAAFPMDRDFQNVANVRTEPEPVEILTDKFGNRWAHFRWNRETRGNEAVVAFDLTNAAAAFTLDTSYAFDPASFPKQVRERWTKETYSFDYSNPVVKNAARAIPAKRRCAAQIVAIRDCVNDALSVVGPSGPEEKASLFLEKGEGRCYAHTLCFAALARARGLPARAIGGTFFQTRKTETETANEHTWNQVYVPGTGWIDIDTVSDAAKDGPHRFNCIGFRPNGFFIAFIGDYDAIDYKRVFTRRGWYRLHAWRSLDRAHRAKVKALPTEIESVDLNAAKRKTPTISRVIDSLVPTLMAEFHVPGVSVAVVRRCRIAWHGEFGVRRADKPEPVAVNTVFEACSMTKPLVAYAAMMLVEQGKLELDRPLVEYLDKPYLPNEPLHKLITARMVLTHATGFPNWRKRGEPLRVLFKPGSKFGYSGEGFQYLQYVMERITGEPLDTFTKHTLLGPIGMSVSSLAWEDRYTKLAAAGHDKDGRAKTGGPRFRQPNAAYSLFCSPSDYARFLIEIMKKRRGKHSLSAKGVQAMLSRYTKVDARTWRGLGWVIKIWPTGEAVCHGGANGTGFRCWSEFYPRVGSGIVIMTNGMSGEKLCSLVMEAVRGMLASARFTR